MKNFKIQLVLVIILSLALAGLCVAGMLIVSPFNLMILNILYIMWVFSIIPALVFSVRYIKRNRLWKDSVGNIFYLGIFMILIPIIISPILMGVYYIDTIKIIKLNKN